MIIQCLKLVTVALVSRVLGEGYRYTRMTKIVQSKAQGKVQDKAQDIAQDTAQLGTIPF